MVTVINRNSPIYIGLLAVMAPLVPLEGVLLFLLIADDVIAGNGDGDDAIQATRTSPRDRRVYTNSMHMSLA
jgi:hypothetical protein